jgi:hypothetical protein
LTIEANVGGQPRGFQHDEGVQCFSGRFAAEVEIFVFVRFKPTSDQNVEAPPVLWTKGIFRRRMSAIM